MTGIGYQPDPLSVLWETAAANAVDVVAAGRGRWYGTLIADPGPRQQAAAAALGIQLGRDIVKGRKAKTRWCRAFVRAFERERKARGLTVQWQVGNRLPALGGRAFRARIRDRNVRVVHRMPLSKRIYDADEDGSAGALWADPAERDWAVNG